MARTTVDRLTVNSPYAEPERHWCCERETRTWYTGKPCERTKKSHINVCVYDSAWEASDAFVLDDSEQVAAWAKNDHLGFEILYVPRRGAQIPTRLSGAAGQW